MNAIELKNLSCGYGNKTILQDISLSIPEGSKVAILGPNGSGKTTLLRAIIGTLKYSGSIKIKDTELSSMKRIEIARNVSVLTQFSDNGFSYTVEETVKLGRYAMGMFSRGTDDVSEVLKETGLWDIKDELVSDLSGGQQQRVFLARTFAQNSPIMLLDEPMNHLDLKNQTELTTSLSKWAEDKSHTLIGIYHDISMARLLADILVFMKDGKIVCVGNTGEIDFKKVLSEVYDMDVYKHMNDIASLWK